MKERALTFSVNIREQRKKMGLTQTELSNRLGYSEKAISKWECGESVPPVESLLQLADIFQCSLDALFTAPAAPKWYLGIDAGGTKTDFALADTRGKILRTVQLGPCNPVDIGIEAVCRRLDEGIRRVTAEIPLREVSVFAGVSGGSAGVMKESIGEFLGRMPFHTAQNGGDTENVIAAGLHGRNGIAVIMGTGSVVYAVKDGKRKRIGGYGYLLDKGGNGYALGRDAVSAALTEEDGTGEKTLLTALVREKLGTPTVTDAIGEIYKGGKRFIASFSPLIPQAIREGDPIAKEIWQRNIGEIAGMLEAAADFLEMPRIPVEVVGGLIDEWELIEQVLREKLHRPEQFILEPYRDKPVKGALMLAGCPIALSKEGETKC